MFKVYSESSCSLQFLPRAVKLAVKLAVKFSLQGISTGQRLYDTLLPLAAAARQDVLPVVLLWVYPEPLCSSLCRLRSASWLKPNEHQPRIPACLFDTVSWFFSHQWNLLQERQAQHVDQRREHQSGLLNVSSQRVMYSSLKFARKRKTVCGLLD